MMRVLMEKGTEVEARDEDGYMALRIVRILSQGGITPLQAPEELGKGGGGDNGHRKGKEREGRRKGNRMGGSDNDTLAVRNDGATVFKIEILVGFVCLCREFKRVYTSPPRR
ncbi:hypothetical protein Cni_G20997 [Canna indica]|uniref:Uncharacterized protein n=1 Tax=Canna indica TaxID=4628 RepID=A0AAQ3QGS9_9LILI|nr:hypothetical protein Cni_G20997 [Canna indica]